MRGTGWQWGNGDKVRRMTKKLETSARVLMGGAGAA
jgi:hypothetical protein